LVKQVAETRGQAAERRVHDVLRAALPADYHLDRLDQLLYVGLTRATTQLVVIASPALAERLRMLEA
jgi:ATP-dependent exoDNAse (exonuclease V) beta subunit